MMCREAQPGMDVLDQIRALCAMVAAGARYVRVNTSHLASYAISLPIDRIAAPKQGRAYHYLGHGADTVAYFLILGSVNFGSGYFPYLRKQADLSGYFTIASCLKRRFVEVGPFAAEELAGITPLECADLFGQELDGGPCGELMTLYARALANLGGYVLHDFSGDFVALVRSAEKSAARLVRILARMPFFDDVQPYGDMRIPFFKRAQLTAADLALAFAGMGYGEFGDLDRLTMFADNLVPHVLRLDGILRYEDSLAGRIDAGEVIPAGSPEEVEIRAVALQAVELLVQILRQRGREVTAMQLDNLLWHRGQQAQYKAHPRHRTRTVFY